MDRLLVEYLPPVLADTREMGTVMAAEQPEVESLWNALRQVLDAGFVQTAGRQGLSRWEKVIGIRPKGTDTLEARRIRILTRMNERLPYTMRVLCQMLTAICGVSGFWIRLYPDRYYLRVRVALDQTGCYEDVRAMLRRVVPANIRLDLALDYNTHEDLHRYTHRRLARYSHRGARENDELKGASEYNGLRKMDKNFEKDRESDKIKTRKLEKR